MLRPMHCAVVAAAVLLGSASTSLAHIVLAPVFTDHAVLQRGMPVPVWGEASPGAPVRVIFGEESGTTTAGADGRFRIDLPAMEASALGRDLAIEAGDERVVIRDVLVGEVWVCGGQSNMEWPVHLSDGSVEAKAEAAKGVRRTIRALKMPHTIAEQELGTNDARWRLIDAETVGSVTAVGYAFGCAIADEIDVPFGILDINWGGTPIEQWMRNGGMFRGMIAPASPFAVRGAIWYQGESNAGAADKYAGQLTEMIGAWRADFGRPEMPFGIVQLASFMEPSDDPVQGGWSDLRAAQASVAATVPHCGLAVTLDVGDAKDIHPRDKRTVGRRLAAWALATEYGQSVGTWSGPVVESVERAEFTDGRKAIRVRFTHGKGLGGRGGQPITGFAIAGADGKFVWATAMVDAASGDPRDHASVVVAADGVADPAEVAYAWQNNPVTANLVNGGGWPAGPFRAKVSE